MHKLDEFAMRILSELEELREENIFSMMNTIFEPRGDKAEIDAFIAATLRLVESDLVQMGTEKFSPRDEVVLSKDEATESLNSLADWFVFDEERQLWSCAKGSILDIRVPIIISTEAGVEAGFKILEERGYQWWREG